MDDQPTFNDVLAIACEAIARCNNALEDAEVVELPDDEIARLTRERCYWSSIKAVAEVASA